MVIENILIFLAASIVLVKSASYAVRSIAKIADHIRFSQFFAAFVLAGFVSIFPELFIGINAALIGIPAVGVGTIIGSNVADMTLLVGIIALVGRKINVGKKTISNNAYFVIITALPILLMIDGNLTRDDGLVLILAFLFYLSTIIKKEKIFSGKKKRNKKAIGKHTVIFLISMLLLFLSAHYMLESGINIAKEFSLPVILVGLLVIALGTTLPEFTFSLRAVLAKHKEIALGDLLGNVAIDSTFTIGVVALISPVVNNFSPIIVSALFMILGALVVTTLMRAGKKITWQESFLLVFIYAMFIIIEIMMKGMIPI